MRQLPREVDPLVFNMSIEDPGDVDYSSVGGLSEQIRELREVRMDVCMLRRGEGVREVSEDRSLDAFLFLIGDRASSDEP